MCNHTQQPLQSGLDRLSANFAAVAGELPACAEQLLAIAPGQPYGAHRLVRRTTIRPGHTTDRHRKARPALRLGATHHGLDHFATDRTNSGEQRLRHIQLLSFLRVGVSDVTGLEPARAAGNPGNRLGDTTAGTGFSRTHLSLGS